MGTRRIFRRGGGAQNVKYPPCLASPGIAWAALVKGSSAYSTKAELIPLFSGALLGCPLSVYAGTAGSMAGAPGRWLCRGCRLGGALLLSFSGRSSLSLLSRLSVLSLPSPGRRWLWGLAGWGIASAGAAWCPSVLMLALVAVLASLGAGAGRCPLLALRPFLSWVLALLRSPSVLSPGCWRSSAVLWCWPAMRWGWVLALGGVGAGVVQAVAVVAGWGWWVVIWRAWDSSCCTNTLLQIWLLFKGKAINFERFFLDIAHKVRYNNTRVKEIVNPLQLTASPSAGRRMDGRREPVNQSERRSAK